MKVERLSFKALKKILDGSIKTTAPCVIKFYSNECHYCHALQEYYEEIATNYSDIYFFAFNTMDAPVIDKMIKINGVPSIVLVRPNGSRRPLVHLLDDPEKPNEHTWYRSNDITNFIERYKK